MVNYDLRLLRIHTGEQFRNALAGRISQDIIPTDDQEVLCFCTFINQQIYSSLLEIFLDLFMARIRIMIPQHSVDVSLWLEPL